MRGNTWSDLLLIFQCSFHRHVFIESVWNAVSSGRQCIYSPWLFLATFNVFSVIPPPFWKIGLPQKAIVLMSGKTVTLWSHRGWNPNPCWRQGQHPQWQQRVQDVMGSALGCCSELETPRGWDLCSCVALYNEVPNLLASRHCRKANAKLCCEQWK